MRAPCSAQDTTRLKKKKRSSHLDVVGLEQNPHGGSRGDDRLETPALLVDDDDLGVREGERTVGHAVEKRFLRRRRRWRRRRRRRCNR